MDEVKCKCGQLNDIKAWNCKKCKKPLQTWFSKLLKIFGI